MMRISVALFVALTVGCDSEEPDRPLPGQYRYTGSEYVLLDIRADNTARMVFRVEPAPGTVDAICDPKTAPCPAGTRCLRVEQSQYNPYGERCLRECLSNAECAEARCEPLVAPPPAPPSEPTVSVCRTQKVLPPIDLTVVGQADTFALTRQATTELCGACRLVDRGRLIECERSAKALGFPASCRFERVADAR